MSKCRIIGAGNAGSLAYSTNVNLNTAGGSKKQGFPTTLGDPLINKHEIKTRTTGENRDVIFTLNQLTGFHTALILRDGLHTKAPYVYTSKNTESFRLEYLVIGGGGGGGIDIGGGGGAGGYIEGQLQVMFGRTFSCSVGEGGIRKVSGQNSYFHNIIALGGGYGGSNSPVPIPAANGGSGGGSRGLLPKGSGSIGQGNDGANSSPGVSFAAGGGGGAASAGTQSSLAQNGNGGNGIASSITGCLMHRAAGGGGAGGFKLNQVIYMSSPAGGSGGLGGAGNGGSHTGAGTSAIANTGSGGGGGGVKTTTAGSGGSGVIVLRYRRGTIEVTGLSYITKMAGMYTVTILIAGTGTVTWTL